MLSAHKEQDIRDTSRYIVPGLNVSETTVSSGYMTALLFFGIDSNGDGAYYLYCLPQEMDGREQAGVISKFMNTSGIIFEENPVAVTDMHFYSRNGNGESGVRLIESRQSFNTRLIEAFFRAQNFRFD